MPTPQLSLCASYFVQLNRFLPGRTSATALSCISALLLTMAPRAEASTWASGGNANWSVSGSWTGGIPDGQGAIANYESTTANGAVTLDSNRTVGQITDSGSKTFTIGVSGGSVLTLDNTGGGTNPDGSSNAYIGGATG